MKVSRQLDMKTKPAIYSLGIVLSGIVQVPLNCLRHRRVPPIPVTVDNFIRAETDRTFASNVKQGAFGKFEHLRELAAITINASSDKTVTRFIRLASLILMPAR